MARHSGDIVTGCIIVTIFSGTVCCGGSGARLSDADRGAARVIGDGERLTQVVRNLLENAAKHTPPGTTVDVHLHQSGSAALLIVADMGPGIAAEHLAHLWDCYYRVDDVRSRESGGTGLGLPSSHLSPRPLVGGQIWEAK
jgi:signal transduction histidine kinase